MTLYCSTPRLRFTTRYDVPSQAKPRDHIRMVRACNSVKILAEQISDRFVQVVCQPVEIARERHLLAAGTSASRQIDCDVAAYTR